MRFIILSLLAIGGVVVAGLVALFSAGGGSARAFTPPASGYYMAIDCDLVTAGVQDDCTIAADADHFDVGIVVGSAATAPATKLGSLDLDVRGPNAMIRPIDLGLDGTTVSSRIRRSKMPKREAGTSSPVRITTVSSTHPPTVPATRPAAATSCRSSKR